jgi:hypothetical protein
MDNRDHVNEVVCGAASVLDDTANDEHSFFL